MSDEARRRLERYGPWAVITGASDGIGRAFARELAREGFHLLLVARRMDALSSLAIELKQAHGIETRALSADLADAAGQEALMRATQELDIGLFIASAGFGTSGPFLNNAVETEINMLALNCAAPLVGTHHFANRFVKRGKGGIILLSSLLGCQGVPRLAHYAATKAYIQVLAEGLRGELKPLGVNVLAVAPGPVKTGFAARAGLTMSMFDTPEAVARGALSKLGRATTVRPSFWAKTLEAALSPLPRMGRTAILGMVSAGMTRQKAHGDGEAAG